MMGDGSVRVDFVVVFAQENVVWPGPVDVSDCSTKHVNRDQLSGTRGVLIGQWVLV